MLGQIGGFFDLVMKTGTLAFLIYNFLYKRVQRTKGDSKKEVELPAE